MKIWWRRQRLLHKLAFMLKNNPLILCLLEINFIKYD